MLPVHVGIIMDGNGRWAVERGKPRTFGHREGLETAKKIVKVASDMGVGFVTLYVFSTENWKRAETEVGFLMGLIEKHLIQELEFYRDNQIRILHIGDRAALPASVVKQIDLAVAETAGFKGTSVVLAINYGGRDEINRAIKAMTEKGVANSDSLEDYLDTRGIPEPDLLIRTGGEKRLSNFLLWQGAYSELYFSDKLWPDWTAEDLKCAIEEYEQRNRRFGNA